MHRFIPAGAGNTTLCPAGHLRQTVHPRWRGEHAQSEKYRSTANGSSPLARGTLPLATMGKPVWRFIPAGAGNTSHLRARPRDFSVHPRWRGEHAIRSRRAPPLPGSSPLARGTPVFAGGILKDQRFIPAGAGNTLFAGIRHLPPAVHPRWRGEHLVPPAQDRTISGSSPLARGTRLAECRWPPPARFIPAGAGNTCRASHRRRSRTVHPRWRGEHCCASADRAGCLGSSPLARGTPSSAFAAKHSSSVHPRWRGEHEWWPKTDEFFSGSSPLARGTQGDTIDGTYEFRFIPAGAGNTAKGSSSDDGGAVHPRWRGEHPTGSPTPAAYPGSSPLARGTPCGRRQTHRRLRFIPAGAGNTGSLTKSCAMTPVHPRWRGEHPSIRVAVALAGGSSPLARGTQQLHAVMNGVQRFIPAGAGNTSRRPASAVRPTVHPRWRGEHGFTSVAEAVECGSSPLARGTQLRGARGWRRRRFIPAGAGNTRAHASNPPRPTVHPRWRGEHPFHIFELSAGCGSSPLARGTRQDAAAILALGRFIPAGAGNTTTLTGIQLHSAVHPRWRGEHCWTWRAHQTANGSSPLARGTQVITETESTDDRFIPAGAGNTTRPFPSGRRRTVHPRWRGEHAG